MIDKDKKRIAAPDLREIVDLHAKASKQLELHRQEYQALLDAGEKVGAQKALQRVMKLETVVRALQAEVK
jgi:hypothetical protein